MQKPLPAWIGQSIRFGLVAPVIFLVDWGVLTALAGLGHYVGRMVSLAAAVFVGFLLNRFFTFQARGKPTATEIRRYAVAAGLGIAVNYGVFLAGVALGLPHAAAIGCGMLAAAAVTFVRFRAVFSGSKKA